MPEELKVDCHECKDLEFARNLAKSMKEGYGRHNSRRDFRYMNFFEAMHRESLEELINLQARVIGRIGDKAIRERWQDCEVGDAVPLEKFPSTPPNSLYWETMIPTRTWDVSSPTLDIRRMSFERVCMRMTSDDGRTWNDEYLWKRIS